MENRTKKRVTMKNGRQSVTAVISWPASWTDENAVSEIKKAVNDAAEVILGDATTEFPDLELTDSGPALSLVHLA